MECQRDGTAVPSLASEYLQEADLLSGPKRQESVQAIKEILGSMFQGKSMRSLLKSVALTSVISWCRHSKCSPYF
jgi:vesicle coat complex subunit